MNSGSEWKWRLLDVFAQSKDDVEMWVDAPGRSLSSPPKPSLNNPNGNAPKHHGRKNPFSLWRSDTECATGLPAAGQAWPLVGLRHRAETTAMFLKRLQRAQQYPQTFHQPQPQDPASSAPPRATRWLKSHQQYRQL
jgi:hypothetical protein